MKYLFFVLTLVFSCSNNKTESINNSGFNDNLYNKIVDYQKENPIPKAIKYNPKLPPPVQSSFIYIYEVDFEKVDNDTIVSITLNLTGIHNCKYKKIYGIYEDNLLKKTYVRDLKYGSGFILDYKFEKTNIQINISSNKDINDKIYQSHRYKIRKNQLVKF